MVMQIKAASWQWLSNDHVVTPTDKNATLALRELLLLEAGS
jgi:hypothetical protein